MEARDRLNSGITGNIIRAIAAGMPGLFDEGQRVQACAHPVLSSRARGRNRPVRAVGAPGRWRYIHFHMQYALSERPIPGLDGRNPYVGTLKAEYTGVLRPGRSDPCFLGSSLH